MTVLYGVRTGDNLETIATMFYGRPDLWPTIAQANNLIPPYISENPRDRYGEPVAALLLATGIVAGSYYTYFPDLKDGALIFQAGYQFYVEERTVTGLSYNVRDIKEYDAAGKRIEFHDAFDQAFPAGCRVLVFLPRLGLAMRVAGPGDALRIPGIEQPEGNLYPGPENVLSPEEWDQAVGTDLALDGNGLLHWDTALRDFATLCGGDNVEQFIAGHLVTRRGQLDHAPWFGSELEDVVGERNNPALAMMVQAYAREAIEQDPRVAAVENMRTTIAGDAIYVTLDVRIMRTGALYRVENLVLRFTQEAV